MVRKVYFVYGGIILKKDEMFIIILSIIFLLLVGKNIMKTTYKNAFVTASPLSGKTILVDAGHGGRDPGALGISGEHERELNLQITLKLQEYLEQAGAYVVLTRSDEKGLYTKTDKNRKRADMRKRKAIGNTSFVDIGISIHQNTFKNSKYRGAQLFYQRGNEESKKLALEIKDEIKKTLDSNNERKVNANSSFYILKSIKIPMIMIECGFMSNAEEEKNLNSKEYQNRLAWVIYKGITNYYKIN